MAGRSSAPLRALPLLLLPPAATRRQLEVERKLLLRSAELDASAAADLAGACARRLRMMQARAAKGGAPRVPRSQHLTPPPRPCLPCRQRSPHARTCHAAVECELASLRESLSSMAESLAAETAQSERTQRLQDDLDRLDAGALGCCRCVMQCNLNYTLLQLSSA